MPKKWIIVHTQAGRENTVKRNIEQNVANREDSFKLGRILVPMDQVTQILAGGKQAVRSIPHFPCYVFVETEFDPDILNVIRHSNGVTGFVGPSGKPSPLPRKDVEQLKRLVEPREFAPVMVTNLSVGDTVKIVSGPFNEFTGKVVEIQPASGKVKVEISFFGRETAVDFSFAEVEKIV